MMIIMVCELVFTVRMSLEAKPSAEIDGTPIAANKQVPWCDQSHLDSKKLTCSSIRAS